MSEKRPVRLVLADDHALVLEGLSVLVAAQPDLRVVATATDGERLLEAIERFRPDVVVMDLQMPYMDGATCLRHIRARGWPVRVLVLSAFGDADSLGLPAIATMCCRPRSGPGLPSKPAPHWHGAAMSAWTAPSSG